MVEILPSVMLYADGGRSLSARMAQATESMRMVVEIVRWLDDMVLAAVRTFAEAR
jgi:hypothetical protein